MPTLRSDIIDVYLFRRSPAVELLQLLRAPDAPFMPATWHPVMGHVEPGETAVACAFRELHEEVGLRDDDPALLGLWSLEQVHPYFIAGRDEIVLSPRFAAEVAPPWRPRLNAEHTDSRWIPAAQAEGAFMWPGQLAAIREIIDSVIPEGSLAARPLRIR